MVRPDLCDYSDAYVIVKGTIDHLASATNNVDEKVLYSKIMLNLDRAYQKIITHSQTMQKLCQCGIFQNIVINVL